IQEEEARLVISERLARSCKNIVWCFQRIDAADNHCKAARTCNRSEDDSADSVAGAVSQNSARICAGAGCTRYRRALGRIVNVQKPDVDVRHCKSEGIHMNINLGRGRCARRSGKGGSRAGRTHRGETNCVFAEPPPGSARPCVSVKVTEALSALAVS